jgi:hypothetical protein
MNRISGVGRRKNPRVAPLSWLWNNGPMIRLPVLLLTIFLIYWQALASETARVVASQIDHDDTSLCIKFGFAADTEAHDACKLELLDLRHSHERLMAANSVP